MTEDEVIGELYRMVQTSKRLLMLWQRTSTLSKDEVLQLRRETRKFQRKSSSRILMVFLEGKVVNNAS